MKKLLIHYEDDLDLLTEVLYYVNVVVLEGRISKNETCFSLCTVFYPPGMDYEIIVLADRTEKGTDTFKIIKQPKPSSMMYGNSPDRVYTDEY